ncbi:MAG: sugar phosphate isomerase/epimerase [Treponema sp.]|nr:sugar phosphate isomerase/epimerase [Treponema sp.]
MKIKYSVNLDAVFSGVDPVTAIEGVKAAGYDCFEFMRYFGKDLQAMKSKADALGVICVSFSGKPKPINLTDPAAQNDFIEVLKGAVEATKIFGNKRLVVTAGDDTGARRDYQHKALVNALKKAVPIAAENNITLMLEPLNGRVNHIGTYLEYSDEGFEIINEVGSANVRLLYDIYHQQITEGDVLRRILANIKLIGHIHTAGSYGRKELDLGELDYRRIIEKIIEAGYDGYIGFEYWPAADNLTGLKRMRECMPR